MSIPTTYMNNLPVTTSTRICGYCSGTGSVFVKNAYDPEYNKEEPCNVCGGTGIVAKPKISNQN
jgi:DnaJ-class molecular chaperone